MTGIAYHQAAAGSEERGNDGRCERSLARQCNGHQMISNQVIIRAGGTVNFIIAGSHQVVVYDDGIQPRNINADLVLPPPLNNLIDDPNGRVYTLNSLAGRLLPSANASESTAWLRSGQSFKLRSSEAVPVTSYTRLQPTRTVTSKY